VAEKVIHVKKPKKKKSKLAYFSREFLVYIPFVFIVICIVKLPGFGYANESKRIILI